MTFTFICITVFTQKRMKMCKSSVKPINQSKAEWETATLELISVVLLIKVISSLPDRSWWIKAVLQKDRQAQVVH